MSTQFSGSSTSAITQRSFSSVSCLSALTADFDGGNEDRDEEKQEDNNRKMVRSAHRPKDSSPRPYVIRESLPCLPDESTSISSADEALECSPGPSCSIWMRVRAEGTHFLEDIVEAFESPQKDHDMSGDNTRLSAVQLRRDIRRCYAASHPFIQCAAALYDLLLWKNPLATLLLMLVFFYSLYRGWLASLLIALFWLQLSLNYLKSKKNIDIGLNFLPRKDISMPKFDITGAQVIYEVAKVGQRLLSLAAGFLEKLEALLTWRDPEVTKIFYGLLVYWLAWSLAFTTGTCIGWCVAALGVRIFLTTFLFKKFPLLRYRLDTYGYFYRNLPLKQKSLRPAISENKSIPKIFTESPDDDGLSNGSDPMLVKALVFKQREKPASGALCPVLGTSDRSERALSLLAGTRNRSRLSSWYVKARTIYPASQTGTTLWWRRMSAGPELVDNFPDE
ncbi:unnamed protein product, partial [Mesorhabditis spiculigera]